MHPTAQLLAAAHVTTSMKPASQTSSIRSRRHAWRAKAVLLGVLALATMAGSRRLMADTYYSVAATGDPTSLTAWTNSAGANPANFTSGDTFIVQNGHNYTIPFNTTWTVNATTAGTAATVQVNSGGTLTFTLSSGSTCQLLLGGNFVQSGTLAGTATSTTGKIEFTADGTWTGSGDISGVKASIQVDSGVSLAASGMSAGFKLKSSNTIGITVNGTLNIGTLTINGNGNTAATFTLGASGTLVTATTSASGLPGIFTGFSAGKITLPTTANYTFNGAAAQVTGTTANNATMPNIVNNLTFNNGAGVTLSQATEVDGVLSLTAGDVTGDVTLGSSGAISGGGSSAYVNGHLTVPFAAPSSVSFTFPVGTASAYSPISLANFTDAGTGTLTASATTSQNPNQSSSGISSTKYVNRYWTLADNGGFISPSYDFTGTFVAGDIQGGANTADLIIRKWDGSSWVAPAGTSSTSTTITGTGFATAFGQFLAGEVETLPVLNSLTQSAITASTATLGATVISDSGSAITDYGIVWSTSPDPTIADHKISAGTAVTPPNTFTVNATGLPAVTTNYYRGYATSANGTGYSTNGLFVTWANEPTIQASGVSGSSLQNGNLSFSWTRGNGAQCLVLVKSGSAVDANPVDGTTYTASATFGSGSLIGPDNYVAYLGTGTSVTLTGLSPDTTYYVAVYELNGAGGSENYLTPPTTGSQTTVASPISALTWTGAESSEWNDTNNWDYLQVPDVGTPVNIPLGGNVPIYSNLMAAASIGSVTMSGPLIVATNGFNIDAGGAVPLTIQASGDLTIVTNGVVTIMNSGSVTMPNPSGGTGPIIDVEGGSLMMTNNSGTFVFGDGASKDTYVGAVFTNNGGSVVIDQQFHLRGRDSQFYMSGGTLDLRGGLNHDVSQNDGRQFFTVAGGTANLGDVTINRATTSGGLSVEGGVVNSSSIRIGIGIASANSRMMGGIWTNAGLFYVSDRNNAATSGTRNPIFTMNDGYLVTLGSDGIVINNQGETSSTGLSGNGGTLTVNGGTMVTEGIQLNGPAVTANSYARFQLTGGTIYLGTVGLVANTSGSSMTASFTLSGGTLAAKDDWASSANLPLSGAVTFDAADVSGTAHNITLNGAVSGGTGALVKTGAGTLTLNGANTYGGSTTISNGILALGAGGTLANTTPIDVTAGGTFDVSAPGGFALGSGKLLSGAGTVVGAFEAASGSTITVGDSVGTLTFSGNLTLSNNALVNFEVSSTTNDLVEVSGNLDVSSGTNTISVAALGGTLAAGTYTLFHYGTSLIGDTNNFSLVGAPGYLTNNVGAHTIQLVTTGIRGPASIVWAGNASANDWDVLDHYNWLNQGVPDRFSQGDTVLFDATGAANPSVNITDPVNPAAVTVDSATDYSFSGIGSIGGAGGLTKTNTGTLTVLTTNSYTGPTVIGQGALAVSTLANGGLNSSLGAADSGTNNLVFYGSTLRYTGTNATTDRGATLNDAGGTIDVASAGTVLTDNGTFAGAGALTKTGPGTLVLGTANSHTGGTVVTNGILQINNVTSLGAGGFTNLGATLKFGSAFYASEVVNFSGNCVIDLNNPSGDGGLRGAWSGDGTVLLTNLNDSARTFTIGGGGDGGGTMTDFTGTLDCGNCVGFIRFNDGSQNNNGSPNAIFDLGTGGVRMVSRNGGVTIDLGALEGGPNTSLAGRASGSSGTVTYSIGALNLDTTFAGTITNYNNATAIVKVGTGKLTLTGTNYYSDTTTVSSGELEVDGAILNSAVTVSSGTLSGTGTFGQSVSVYDTLSPGDSGIGTMTVNGDLVLGGTTIMEVNKSTDTNDMVTGITNLYLGGQIIVTNLSGTLTNGTVFKLFSAQTYNGDFYSGITLPDLAPGLSWETNLTVDGTIRIAPLTNSPVMTSVVSGMNLTVSWPETQTGWTLEVQTNDLATGLNGVWTLVPDSDLIHSYTTPIDPASPTVFYRLVYNPTP